MKKFIFIVFAAVFAAVLAGFAISCQKEELVSEKTEAVQYTFNITVNDQVGFDSDASTKGGSSEKYKTEWENKDKIFLFFKPTDGILLEDRYATLTYNGSSWDGTVSSGSSSLGEEGTLSAVYVYNLGDVTPEFDDDDNQWTIATGNTFYNCQTEVSYTVSGSNEISASLNLKAPANFVRFSVVYASGALTCDKVKGWKDVAIGSDLAVSNVTCTGYMVGSANIGDVNVMDYYGRIVSGTSLKNVACKFSVVKNGKVYEHSATPPSDARSFKIDGWTEAKGKLPGLFTVANGADGKAGTADDIQVRFSQGNLVATINDSGAPTAWKFAANQYDCLGEGEANKTIGSAAGDIDLFGWSTAATKYGISTSTSSSSYSGDFVDWGTNIGDGSTWRTLSQDESVYLFKSRTNASSLYKCGVTVCGKENCLIIAPDNWDTSANPIQDTYDATAWATAEAAGLVCLPAAGYRRGSNVDDVGRRGFYWSSTAYSGGVARMVFFNFTSSNVFPEDYERRDYGCSVRLITECQ